MKGAPFLSYPVVEMPLKPCSCVFSRPGFFLGVQMCPWLRHHVLERVQIALLHVRMYNR